MGFDLSADDLRVFLEEAEEQLQLLEEDIVKLERMGDDESLLQEIFRAAHTLKGSSATLGHQKMAELTHSMENLLDKLRKHTLPVSTALIDVLFACLDALRAFKEEIATDAPADVDVPTLVARIQQVGGEAGAAPAHGGVAQSAPAPAGAGAANALPSDLPELEWNAKQHLTEAFEEGKPVVRLVVALDANSPMPSVRAFQVYMGVQEQGKVIWSRPTLNEIEEEQVGNSLEMIAVAPAGPDAVAAAVVAVPEVALAEMREVTPVAAAPVQTAHPAAQEQAAARTQGTAGASAQAAPGQAAARTQGTAGANAQAAPGQAAARKGGRTVRVDVEVLDNLMNLVGELVIDRTRLTQIVSHLDSAAGEIVDDLGRTSSHIGRITADLQEEIMRARMLPVENLFKKFPRMVRDLAQSLQKEINFIIRGEETELDRSVIEEIGDPLMHLLRNAVDHAIEPPAVRLAAGKPAQGTVLLEAAHEENSIIITVRDDGKGIDPQWIRGKAVEKGVITEEAARRLDDAAAINLIFAPGFSTAEKLSEVSGRGVGMDVVKSNIEKLNGSVEIRSEVGKGTEFRIKLPLTLAIIQALLVGLRNETYAIPLTSVLETIRVTPDDIKTIRTNEVIVVRGRVLPLIRLDRVFQCSGLPEDESESFVVIVGLGASQYGLVVDRLIGEQEVVIKSLGKFVGEVPGISGATILGDGSVSLIVDLPSLMESSQFEAVPA